MVQEASLDKKSYAGYKIENGLLFGTTEWFDAIDNGIILKYLISGSISNIYLSGQNDYTEFEITSDEDKTTWPIKGDNAIYKIGKNITLTYIEQKFKRPSDITGLISKCIISIEIEA